MAKVVVVAGMPGHTMALNTTGTTTDKHKGWKAL